VDTLVLVLTDVQGSTRLWQDEPEAMDAAMRRHHAILHAAVAEHDGWRPVDQGEGDAVFAAFRSGTAAAAAVVDVQRRLAAEPWPTREPLTVRIGVHVGDVTERDGNLHGDAVSRCARLRGLAVGGQTLLSAISVGRRPTFHPDAAAPMLEAYLLDFDGDLYGERAKVRFCSWLRPEERFDSVDALVTQIGRDVEATRVGGLSRRADGPTAAV